MTQYINKAALVAEIERITDEQQEICKADVALGKAPDSKNIEVIYQFQQFTKFLDTLEVKEVDLEEEFADFLEKENAYIDDNNVISYYNGSSFNHTCDIYPLAKHFLNSDLKQHRKEKRYDR